jgi:hypothetical protein
MIINYNCNHSFIVLATVITIINYNRKTFIVPATRFQLGNCDIHAEHKISFTNEMKIYESKTHKHCNYLQR